MRSAITWGCSTVMMWWVITPGMRILPGGSSGFLPHAPFMLVTRICGFERVRAGLHLQDEIDDVLERRI